MANPKVSQSKPIIKMAFSGNPINSKVYLIGDRNNDIITGTFAKCIACRKVVFSLFSILILFSSDFATRLIHS